MTDQEVLHLLNAAFRRRIPSGPAIIRNAISNALDGHEDDPEWIKAHFSDLIETVQLAAYEEYLNAEASVGADAIRTTFSSPPVGSPANDADAVLDLISTHFRAFDRFFLALTQGRRPRAGKAFESVLKQLFTKLDYPFDEQIVINGQPDFLLPSEAHWHRNPMDCIIFTAKRTLRERWRQIVTEGTRGLGFFLATIDTQVSSRDLGEMLRHRIYLVMPASVKAARDEYRSAANVLSFEEFFQLHLDPAMVRWRSSGAV